MSTYCLLLRSVNIGGRNKVVMKTLKKDLENLGFIAVETVLNSGNIVFTSKLDKRQLSVIIEEYLKQNYDFDIPYVLLEQSQIDAILQDKPSWWDPDNKTKYHIYVFVLPSANLETIERTVGDTNNEYETVVKHCHGFYASILLDGYSKSKWGNIAGTSANVHTTVRTCKTIQKISSIF